MSIPVTEADVHVGYPAVWAFISGLRNGVAGAWERINSTGGALWTQDQPFIGARTVDLSADTTFLTPPRSIYVGTAGNLKVDMYDLDGTTLLTGKTIVVTDFQVLPFGCVKKIYSTSNGTSASNLVVGA
jgi:hypothetical protein